MKRVTFIIVMALVGLVGYAQSDSAKVVKFGYLSYDSVRVMMPEYAEMLTSMQQLTAQYEAEQKRTADDFNKKYEAFLDGQASFPKTILQKRQSELQEILDKNIAFKKESQKLLKDAEATFMATINQMINTAVAHVAQERGFAFVLNTDKEAVTFINPEMGEDITETVKQFLNDK